VISKPTSLPQAADAKRDKAEAGELGQGTAPDFQFLPSSSEAHLENHPD
jgi:hypothetical protein